MGASLTMHRSERFDRDLADVVRLSGDDQSDSIRKAIRLYATHLRNEQAGGRTRMIYPDGDSDRLMIL